MDNISRTASTDSLRPYQWKGVNFLLRRKTCLLADEMGLGKTVQVAKALSLLLPKSKYGRALIVVPAALKINWEKEIDRWAPKLSFRRLQGDNHERFANYNLPIRVLIASYEQIREDAMALSDLVNFEVVVLDEAQKIKNNNSKASFAVRILRRERSWAMTGTPVENSVGDLFSIFRFVKKDLLNQSMNRPTIHKLMKPYFLRRIKSDVLPEMPPIVLQDIPIELSYYQREAYNKIWNERYGLVNKGGGKISNASIFSIITKLKQACNYDAESGESSKIETLKLIIENLSRKTDKLIVFSQYVDTLKLVARNLNGLIPNEIYHGALSEDARNMTIKSFREEEGPRVLLVSIKAGGVGLNLQEASSVVLFDRWWNPAVEEQAINRAHRFNRESTLHVFRFSVVDSIEDKILGILEKKQVIFDQYVNKAQTAELPNLNIEDLMKLLELQTALSDQ